MCERNETLQLCTCSDMDTKTIRRKYYSDIKRLGRQEILHVLQWRLMRYVGRKCSMKDGLILMPVDTLTAKFTDSYVLQELNSRNCFDFDYEPNEGDNLRFGVGWVFGFRGKGSELNLGGGYMSYIFRDNKWVADFYDSFIHETEVVKEGLVTTIETIEENERKKRKKGY